MTGVAVRRSDKRPTPRIVSLASLGALPYCGPDLRNPYKFRGFVRAGLMRATTAPAPV